VISKTNHSAKFYHLPYWIHCLLPGPLVEDGEDLSDRHIGGLAKLIAGQFFGHRVKEGDGSGPVGSDYRVSNAGQRRAQPTCLFK
jgi:hypothetical protein